MNERHHELLNALEQGSNQQLLALQNEQKKIQNHFEKIQTRKEQVALAKLQEENKVLYMDLTKIDDPELREIVRKERAWIWQKRNEERGASEDNIFGKFIVDFGGGGSGSGSDFPDY